MALEVDAIYENGVLRPLQPLDLEEHERVIVSVVKVSSTPATSRLAVEYTDRIKSALGSSEPAPGREEVRKRLAKIPGSMAAEIIAEREEC
jgi:predicted DNA-binding antitoxin AbrB/MazE fold protein